MFEGFAAHRASEQHFDLINGLIYEVGETMAKRKHFGITASGLAFVLLFAIVPALSVPDAPKPAPTSSPLLDQLGDSCRHQRRDR